MFPSPLDIPSAVDCVALARTGLDSAVPLMIGLVAVVIGVAAFAVSRRRSRRGFVGLGLVLLLVAGGSGLAVAAPASPAAADDCTPLDYQLDAELESPALIDSGDDVVIEFWLTNVVDRDGTPPITVSIPRFAGSGSPALLGGTNWALDAASDPDAYLLTYSGPLPRDTVSSVAAFSFDLETEDSALEEYSIPVSIVTGSGGDTDTANNTVTLEVDVDGTLDYALTGTISPDTAAPASPLPSGGTATIDLRVTNVVSRDGASPVVLRIVQQPAISNVALSGASTGWTLTVDGSYYYVLTYSPVLAAGAQSSVASLTFTASNGNSSPTTLTIPANLDSGTGGGDSNQANDAVSFALRVGGVVP